MSSKTIPAQIVDAIREEDLASISKLFERNPDQLEFATPFGSQTWLGYASQIGKLASVRKLTEIGMDINRGDQRDDRKPICSASANNHPAVVSYLLSQRAILDTSLSVRNPLFSAIVGRSPPIVTMLLTGGIDSNVRYNSSTMKDVDALAFALIRGELQCAELIAEWNANGSGDVAESLLERGRAVANLNS